jgi:SH3-like domain-containing protein
MKHIINKFIVGLVAVQATMLVTQVNATPPVKKFVLTAVTMLKAKAETTAPTIAALKRGDEVTVLEETGIWAKVKPAKAGEMGWVLKAALATEKPVTQAELNQSTQRTEKMNRMRASARPVTMGVRGLTDTSRAREGREQHRSDFEAVGKMENRQVDDKKLNDFRKAAKLPE